MPVYEWSKHKGQPTRYYCGKRIEDVHSQLGLSRGQCLGWLILCREEYICQLLNKFADLEHERANIIPPSPPDNVFKSTCYVEERK